MHMMHPSLHELRAAAEAIIQDYEDNAHQELKNEQGFIVDFVMD